MRTVHSVVELRELITGWRRQAETVVLVPTMGNLHAGHVSLIDCARRLPAEGSRPRVVASIFVNPLQFGPGEDFDRYPRTLDADAERLQAAGADLLFAPPIDEIYPQGYPPSTQIQVGGLLTEVLEGAFRPGHFSGVATVVNILFNLVQPDAAIFGEKDWQQLAVIRRMTADLRLPIEIVGAPTMREPDGLAMSSRNQYLDSAQRCQAASLNRALAAVATELRAGRRDFPAITAAASETLTAAGYRLQYLEVRSPDLTPIGVDQTRFQVLVAAYLGTTRLIDNVGVDAEIRRETDAGGPLYLPPERE